MKFNAGTFMIAFFGALVGSSAFASPYLSGTGAAAEEKAAPMGLFEPAVLNFLGSDGEFSIPMNLFFPAGFKYGDANGNPVDTRSPLPTFNLNDKNTWITAAFSDSGELSCKGGRSTATIVGRRNVLISTAHVFVKETADGSYMTNADGSPSLRDNCYFFPDGKFPHSVALAGSQIFLGFMDPVDRSLGVPNFDSQNDWAVIKLGKDLPMDYSATASRFSMSESDMQDYKYETYNVGYHLDRNEGNVKMISKCRVFESGLNSILHDQKNIFLHNCTTAGQGSGSGIYIRPDPNRHSYVFVGLHVGFRAAPGTKDGDPNSVERNSGVAIALTGRLLKRFKWACQCGD